MNFTQLTEKAKEFLATAPCNYISPEDALEPSLAGMRIYDEPIFGVAAADDQSFRTLLSPSVVGPETLLPTRLLPGAKSVVSFFLPFSEEVRRSNAIEREGASPQWLHARIEGQIAIMELANELCRLLRGEGFQALVPVESELFRSVGPVKSNWSERHVAWACGLGTFGVSRGLITEKGMAGRFASLVTDAVLPPTEHKYSGAFDYCIMCGACARQCPVNAIDLSRGVIDGKSQQICAPYVAGTKTAPTGVHQRVYYGCGKCQVNVPCEMGVPLRRK